LIVVVDDTGGIAYGVITYGFWAKKLNPGFTVFVGKIGKVLINGLGE
jgi:hypothetical protein